MAARRSARRDDEDALDPVEAADVESDADEVDVEDPELEGPDLDEVEPGDDVEADAEQDLEVDDEFVADDEDETGAEVVRLAVFDDEDEEIVRVVTEDDSDDDVDGLRDGEFVCRSCFMAKRETALADPKRLLCRDCA